MNGRKGGDSRRQNRRLWRAAARASSGQGLTSMAIFTGDGLLRPMVPAIRAVAVMLAVLPTLCGHAAAQGAVRSVHGDWQIRCDTPPGAQGEQCALMQSVQSEERPNVGLTIIILRPAGTSIHLMRVLAPPGVLLPQALGLKIDDVNVGRAGYVRCLPNGCVAEVTMNDDLIQKLRNGHTATFIIFLTPEEGIGFPVSLKGFGEGFDQLP